MTEALSLALSHSVLLPSPVRDIAQKKLTSQLPSLPVLKKNNMGGHHTASGPSMWTPTLDGAAYTRYIAKLAMKNLMPSTGGVATRKNHSQPVIRVLCWQMWA